MNRSNVTELAGAGVALLLGLMWTLQASAQNHSGGAKPSGAPGGAMHAGGLGNSEMGVDRGSPRPAADASTQRAANASTAAGANAKAKLTAESDCAKAKAAIAAAGTGGTTDKGRGGAAGADGRAKAAEAVCQGADADTSASKGKSTEAPGQTGVTGTAQAIQRADEHAKDGLDKAQSNPQPDQKPEHVPPQ
jgi:hypothetical protein